MPAAIRRSIMVSALLTAVCGFGCTASPAIRAERAEASVAELKSDISVVDKQIDATLAALDNLGKDAYVRGSYAVYAQQLSRMHDEINHVRKLESQIIASRTSYFAGRDSIQSKASDTAVQNANDAAREDILGHYGQAQTALTEVRMDMDPFLNELQNVKTYLEGNPTQSQVEDMTGMIQRAKIAARTVKQQLGLAISELSILETSLAKAPR